MNISFNCHICGKLFSDERGLKEHAFESKLCKDQLVSYYSNLLKKCEFEGCDKDAEYYFDGKVFCEECYGMTQFQLFF